MFISVDLPAPFSPSSAWISPRLRSKSTPAQRLDAAEMLDDAAHDEQRGPAFGRRAHRGLPQEARNPSLMGTPTRDGAFTALIAADPRLALVMTSDDVETETPASRATSAIGTSPPPGSSPSRFADTRLFACLTLAYRSVCATARPFASAPARQGRSPKWPDFAVSRQIGRALAGPLSANRRVRALNRFRLAQAVLTMLALSAPGAACAAPADPPVAVTPDNFVRAESDLYFSGVVKDGGFGKFLHRREPTAIAKQTIIRMNRDTLYSAAVFDLDAGPVTIALPDPGKRFLSMQVIDEDEYSPEVVYGAHVRTLTKDQIGTRYVLVGVRILVDPDDPKDVETVHALQDAIAVSQPGGPGKFAIPNWDASSQVKVRNALLALASTLPDTKGMFGPKGEVDPVRHLIGSASAWGGNPERDALYLNVTPSITTARRSTGLM